LLFYAAQLARHADRRLPVLRNGRAALPSERVDDVLTAAHLLSAQLRDIGTGRAWHPSGLADATDWAGVAVTEVVVHGSDVASALHLELPSPAEACSSTWAAAAGSHRPRRGAWVRVDQEWWWQSAPLSQWDGAARRRTPFAGLGVRATTADQIEPNCSPGELVYPSVRD